MGSLFSPYVFIILLSLVSLEIQAQEIKSSRLLDLFIRDYTFKSYDTNFRTGIIHTVDLPSNFSGIKVDSARFRCGSLARYGAQVKEFHLGIGVSVQPCVERIMVITQNLGHTWSSIYFASYNLSGYQLVSPILGLLAYNFGNDVKNFSNPFEVGIHAGEKPITIDFSNISDISNLSRIRPICATFGNDGKVMLKTSASPHMCVAAKHGHFGLVIKSPPRPPPQLVVKRKVSLWKVVVGSMVGAALGAFLVGLLLVAIFVKVKKKARMEEMERRAYEEEALQVSMVGHVRAPIATVIRTLPRSIEHEYSPFPS